MIKRDFSQVFPYNISENRVKSGVKKKGDFEMRRICLVLVLLAFVVFSVALCSCAYNPRNAFGWSNKTWGAITKGSVFVGMTEKQALMAWGQPDDVETTSTRYSVHEMWVYERSSYNYNFLHFEDRKLVSIHR